MPEQENNGDTTTIPNERLVHMMALTSAANLYSKTCPHFDEALKTDKCDHSCERMKRFLCVCVRASHRREG